MAPPAPVALLTDFGLADTYVGVMKGVIAQITPTAQVVDLSHGVPPQDVWAAACALLFSYRYFPAGTVFCCVVDPGVGTGRKGIAVELEMTEEVAVRSQAERGGRRSGRETGGRSLSFVCPDNGLLTPLLASPQLRDSRAVVLDDPRYHLPSMSKTFHGRDVFAPAAAHLAGGAGLLELGSRLWPGDLVRIPWPAPERTGKGWVGQVIHIDGFGNLITDLPGDQLTGSGHSWRVTVAGRTVPEVSATFGEVEIGQSVAYIGSSGLLEVAVRQGSAAREWGCSRGEQVQVEQTNP